MMRRSCAFRLKSSGSSIVIFLLFLIIVPTLVSFLALKVVSGVIGLVVAGCAQLLFTLLVRYIYVFRIGSIHPWYLKKLQGGKPHSRSGRTDVTTSSGHCVSIHTVPCLVDNYAYVIVNHGPPPALPNFFKIISLGSGSAHGVEPSTSTASAISFKETVSNVSPTLLDTWPKPEDTGVQPELLPSLHAAVVDAGDCETILDAIAAISNLHYEGRPINIDSILTTHHHHDHQHGNRGLVQRIPGLRVFGGWRDQVDCCTHPVGHGDIIKIGNQHGVDIEVIETPCHTHGSVIYKLRCIDQIDCLFTGDTLFLGGCGAAFEGSRSAMYNNFWQIERHCHPSSLVFPVILRRACRLVLESNERMSRKLRQSIHHKLVIDTLGMDSPSDAQFSRSPCVRTSVDSSADGSKKDECISQNQNNSTRNDNTNTSTKNPRCQVVENSSHTITRLSETHSAKGDGTEHFPNHLNASPTSCVTKVVQIETGRSSEKEHYHSTLPSPKAPNQISTERKSLWMIPPAAPFKPHCDSYVLLGGGGGSSSRSLTEVRMKLNDSDGNTVNHLLAYENGEQENLEHKKSHLCSFGIQPESINTNTLLHKNPHSSLLWPLENIPSTAAFQHDTVMGRAEEEKDPNHEQQCDHHTTTTQCSCNDFQGSLGNHRNSHCRSNANTLSYPTHVSHLNICQTSSLSLRSRDLLELSLNDHSPVTTTALDGELSRSSLVDLPHETRIAGTLPISSNTSKWVYTGSNHEEHTDTHDMSLGSDVNREGATGGKESVGNLTNDPKDCPEQHYTSPAVIHSNHDGIRSTEKGKWRSEKRSRMKGHRRKCHWADVPWITSPLECYSPFTVVWREELLELESILRRPPSDFGVRTALERVRLFLHDGYLEKTRSTPLRRFRVPFIISPPSDPIHSPQRGKLTSFFDGEKCSSRKCGLEGEALPPDSSRHYFSCVSPFVRSGPLSIEERSPPAYHTSPASFSETPAALSESLDEADLEVDLPPQVRSPKDNILFVHDSCACATPPPSSSSFQKAGEKNFKESGASSRESPLQRGKTLVDRNLRSVPSTADLTKSLQLLVGPEQLDRRVCSKERGNEDSMRCRGQLSEQIDPFWKIATSPVIIRDDFLFLLTKIGKSPFHPARAKRCWKHLAGRYVQANQSSIPSNFTITPGFLSRLIESAPALPLKFIAETLTFPRTTSTRCPSFLSRCCSRFWHFPLSKREYDDGNKPAIPEATPNPHHSDKIVPDSSPYSQPVPNSHQREKHRKHQSHPFSQQEIITFNSSHDFTRCRLCQAKSFSTLLSTAT